MYIRKNDLLKIDNAKDCLGFSTDSLDSLNYKPGRYLGPTLSVLACIGRYICRF